MLLVDIRHLCADRILLLCGVILHLCHHFRDGLSPNYTPRLASTYSGKSPSPGQRSNYVIIYHTIKVRLFSFRYLSRSCSSSSAASSSSSPCFDDLGRWVRVWLSLRQVGVAPSYVHPLNEMTLIIIGLTQGIPFYLIFLWWKPKLLTPLTQSTTRVVQKVFLSLKQD